MTIASRRVAGGNEEIPGLSWFPPIEASLFPILCVVAFRRW